MGRLTELVAKLEEDLLAADAGGGGGGGGERHKAGINGIVADGEAQGCRWGAARHAPAAVDMTCTSRRRDRTRQGGRDDSIGLTQGPMPMAT